ETDAAELKTIDQLLEIDGAGRILGRVHLDVPRVVDREVAIAPTGDFVELAGVVHRPCGRGRRRRAGRQRRRGAPVGQCAHVTVMINGLWLSVSGLRSSVSSPESGPE